MVMSCDVMFLTAAGLLQVLFEALKKGGMRNDIALDDIALISEPCGPAPPEPTNVPPPATTPPIPGVVLIMPPLP